MHITLNGEAHVAAEGTTVLALLEELGYTGKRVAVERNGAIVPKSQHPRTALANHDTLEIVVAVGGG